MMCFNARLASSNNAEHTKHWDFNALITTGAWTAELSILGLVGAQFNVTKSQFVFARGADLTQNRGQPEGGSEMRCKIDNGMLEHLGQEGYTERWKCRRCRVVWELAPRGDVDTDGTVIANIMKKKLEEMEGVN